MSHVITQLDPVAGTGWCGECSRFVDVLFVRNGISHKPTCPNEHREVIGKAENLTPENKEPYDNDKLEHQVQKDVVDALIEAGCLVQHTSAFRQKKASGVSKGIADLLVRWPGLRPGYVMQIEVKNKNGKPSEDQQKAHENQQIAGFASSPFEALRLVVDAMDYSVPERVRLQAISVLKKHEVPNG